MNKVFKFKSGYFKQLPNGRFSKTAKLEDADHVIRPLQEVLIKKILNRHHCNYEVVDLDKRNYKPINTMKEKMTVKNIANVIYDLTLTMSDVEAENERESEVIAIAEELKILEKNRTPLFEALKFIAMDKMGYWK